MLDQGLKQNRELVLFWTTGVAYILTDDKSSMCAILNEYFSTVFTVEDTSTIPELILRDDNNQPKIIDDEFTTIDINVNKVLQAMTNLKVNKAGGIDELHSSFLLGVKEAIALPLSILFKYSLESG